MQDQEAEIPIVHAAELEALWAVSGRLDKELVEPFLPEYLEMVTRARDRLSPTQED
jgi:hypothetical protein